MIKRRVKGHSRGRKGHAPHSVRSHSRSASPAKRGAFAHGFKGDKWPPPHKGMSRERLVAYEQRLLKEHQALSNGTRVALHAGHPAFIRKRLQQVRKILASTHS